MRLGWTRMFLVEYEYDYERRSKTHNFLDRERDVHICHLAGPFESFVFFDTDSTQSLATIAMGLCCIFRRYVMHQCTARVSLFTTLSFEFSSALILTIFPVVMFKALRSTSTLRRVMAACMGVIGSLLLGGSIARAIYFIPGKNPSLEQLTTIIQVGTGLIVINIPALVLLSAGEEGGILDSPQKTAVDEGSKGLPTSRPVIGIPRPLSSKSSFMTSQTPSDKPETPDVPYHFSFFPPFSNEERREKALLFGLHVDSWYKVPKSPTSSSDDHLKPPHDSLTSSASMYSTDPAAAQFMTQGRNVRFKSSPSIIPQTKSISDSEAESTVRDSGFSDTSIARPPPVAGCYSPRPVERPRSWMSISLDASDHSTQAASSSSSRLRVESPVPITPARICSLEPPPISTAPSAWHSLAPGPGDTPSQVGSELPSWMSGFDSLTYSSFVHRYFVDKDPFGQDLAEPPRPSTFFEGPEAPERASVAPRPF
ncbi:hypothetical protein PQX77_016496 [Marasmius sp. AFHP31]|nr:hypothetical protein PQX77_016496 [Marasmius sp. AFHP31]